ncbi:hypothetical protein B0G80_4414 [Paraburkholderia sp. BL6669N2]|nr:hypothetical protein B0G80_4414 [Paraburkholderia sp. BL6669N2]
MRHIPKLIFAAGAALLAYSIYGCVLTPFGWYGATSFSAMTPSAIGLLVASIAAEYLFCRTSA